MSYVTKANYVTVYVEHTSSRDTSGFQEQGGPKTKTHRCVEAPPLCDVSIAVSPTRNSPKMPCIYWTHLTLLSLSVDSRFYHFSSELFRSLLIRNSIFNSLSPCVWISVVWMKWPYLISITYRKIQKSQKFYNLSGLGLSKKYWNSHRGVLEIRCK